MSNWNDKLSRHEIIHRDTSTLRNDAISLVAFLIVLFVIALVIASLPPGTPMVAR